MEQDFTVKLLEWDKTLNTRKMPWKGEKDPYKIWLSEIILQQTRVEQGLKYYEKFVSEFPCIKDLASADDAKVFKLWEGLGYYSRCRNLLATARTIVDQYNGIFPSDYDQIHALKGIGSYTAAAISSFAFGDVRAVVDGNVQRVLSRYFGIDTPIDSASGKKLYQQLAQSLISAAEPARYNQAIMDFGAVICKPQQPLCFSCVQQPLCEASRLGLVDSLPVKEKNLKKVHRWFDYFIIESDKGIFIRQRLERDIWNSLHEFVLLESDSILPDENLKMFLKRLFKQNPFSIIQAGKTYKQQLTHQVIYGRFFRVTAKQPPDEIPGYMLVDRQRIREYAFPNIIVRYFEESAIGE